MSLRDRLLALLRDPAYSPGNEFELSRRLDLKKRDRASLGHEVRLLLKSGDFVRGQNGRITQRESGGGASEVVEQRKIFVPTRRGPSMPPPEIREHSPVEKVPPVQHTRRRTRNTPANAEHAPAKAEHATGEKRRREV